MFVLLIFLLFLQSFFSGKKIIVCMVLCFKGTNKNEIQKKKKKSPNEMIAT